MDPDKEILRDLYDQVLEQLELAIECFEEVATPKVRGGEATEPQYNAKVYKEYLVKTAAIRCGFCKYHRQENAKGTPKHISWKARTRNDKPWGNRPKVSFKGGAYVKEG